MRLSGFFRSLLGLLLVLTAAACSDVDRPTATLAPANTPPSSDMVDCGSTDPKVCDRIRGAIFSLMSHGDGLCRDLGYRANTRFHSATYGFRSSTTIPPELNEANLMWTETLGGVPLQDTWYHTSVFSDDRYSDPTWELRIPATIAHEELHHLGLMHDETGDMMNSLQRCIAQPLT